MNVLQLASLKTKKVSRIYGHLLNQNLLVIEIITSYSILKQNTDLKNKVLISHQIADENSENFIRFNNDKFSAKVNVVVIKSVYEF